MFMRTNAQSILSSPTATNRTKEIAARIESLTVELIESLKEMNE